MNVEQEIATRLKYKYGPAVDCDGIAALVYSYILAERERCAKIADDEPNFPGPMPKEVREQVEKAITNGKLEDICRHFSGSMQRTITKKIREG